jgi:F-type H+-transporting ATPase subunit gamma
LQPELPEVVIAVTSDRGLCGGFNSSTLRSVEEILRGREATGKETRIVAVGKKAQSYFRYRNIAVLTEVLTVTDRPSFPHVKAILGDLLNRFESGEIGAIRVASYRFISAGNQRLAIEQLVPIAPELLRLEANEQEQGLDFEFEPSSDSIVIPLMRQFVEAKLFALLLEASASEHAARQRAMKAASDNADELAKVYRRQLNRARQDSITNEIMEIVGGAEALSHAGSGSDHE